MPLVDPLGFQAAEPQRLGQLVLGNPLLTVESDQVHLPRVTVEVRPLAAHLLLDLLP